MATTVTFKRPDGQTIQATWPSRSTLRCRGHCRHPGMVGVNEQIRGVADRWRAQVTSHSCPTSTAASRRLRPTKRIT